MISEQGLLAVPESATAQSFWGRLIPSLTMTKLLARYGGDSEERYCV